MAIQDGIGYLRATFNQNLHFTENSDAYANLLYPYIQDDGGNSKNVSLSIDVINADQNFTTKDDKKQQEWTTDETNGGNLLLDQLIWGFKETTHSTRNSKALSSAFTFNDQQITIQFAKEGHPQGYLGNDYVYARSTIELSVVDLVRGTETTFTPFKGLELDENDESRTLKWIIPQKSNPTYQNYGFFGLFAFRIKVTSKYYIDAHRNVRSKHQDRVTNSYLQLLTYNSAKEAIEVQSSEIDIFLSNPNANDSFVQLFNKSIFANLESLNQNPLSDEQKRAIMADQIAVLFMSQHPVVSSDLTPAKIQGFGGEEAVQPQKIVEKTITYSERYDQSIIQLAQNRLFGMLSNYQTFSFADEMNNLFATGQSSQTIVESSRIIYMDGLGNLSDDIGVEGILFTPYSIENLHTEIMSDVPPADPFSIPLYKYSVGIDTLVVTKDDDTELSCGDSDIKLSFNITFGEEKVQEVYYQTWIRKNNAYNEYIDKNGVTREHSFDFSTIGGISCSSGSGDIVTARVTILDVYGFSNVFERQLFYSLDSEDPAITEITSFQRQDGSGLIDVFYYYRGASEINPANITLTYSTNNASFSSITTNVIGDIGLGIMPGYRKITWNPNSVLTSSNDVAFMKIGLTDVDESSNAGIITSSVVVVDLSVPEVAIRKLSIREDEEMAESSSLSDSSSSLSSSSSSEGYSESESSQGYSESSSEMYSESSSSSSEMYSESSSSSKGYSESSSSSEMYSESSSSEGYSESSSSSEMYSESSSSEGYSESSSSSEMYSESSSSEGYSSESSSSSVDIAYKFLDCATGLVEVARRDFADLPAHDYLWIHDGSDFVKSYNDGISTGAATGAACEVMMSTTPANCAAVTYAAFDDSYDDNSFDTCRGTISVLVNGTATEQNGVLELRYDDNAAYSQAKNTLPVVMTGDFDMTLSFESLSIPMFNSDPVLSTTQSYGLVTLIATIGGVLYTVRYHHFTDDIVIVTPTTVAEGAYANHGSTLIGEAGFTLPSSGSLRIKRVGTTLTFYYGATSLGTATASGDAIANFSFDGRTRAVDGTATCDITQMAFTGG